MQLINVISASHTGVEGVIDLVLEADIGTGQETLPFTYSPADPYGLSPLVGAYLEAHPELEIGDYVPPTPSTDPADYPLSDRQLRLGLIAAGILPSAVRNTIISSITDPFEQEAALTWFDRTAQIHWNHPQTQQLMALAGFTQQQAAAMWLQAKDIAA